jgi:hypothetical protein
MRVLAALGSVEQLVNLRNEKANNRLLAGCVLAFAIHLEASLSAT